jgi:hypothetical protein
MKVLFGVFDWGLGHATRSTPLIEVLAEKNEVHILSTGRALELLKDHFKNKCYYYDVSSVHFSYPRSRFFATKFALSMPRIVSSLKKARKKTKEIINKNKYDIVVSDCRYDVYDKKESSFLINHQLKFKAPAFQFVTSDLLSRKMGNYSSIIVPDFPERELTGTLSLNPRFRGEVNYIGILSRVKEQKKKLDIDFFISISGPEPQRSIFEKKILKQINELNGRKVITGGAPEAINKKKEHSIEYFSYLNLKQQEDMMNRAKFIISRPGYSTVMELVELNKKNILFVPTPGQTEQEYLANLYEKKGIFHHMPQSKVKLREEVDKSRSFSSFSPERKTKDSVKNFMEIISN